MLAKPNSAALMWMSELSKEGTSMLERIRSIFSRRSTPELAIGPDKLIGEVHKHEDASRKKRPSFTRDWPASDATPGHADSEMFAAERNGIRGVNLVKRTQVEDFLDACGLEPDTARWEGALAGVPIEIDGGSIRFIRQT